MHIVEQTHLRKIIERIIARGYRISVFDGEDYPIKRSSDADAVFAECGSTDADRLCISDPKSNDERVGSILLVYGNGVDLVADYSWNRQYKDSMQIMDRLTEDYYV